MNTPPMTTLEAVHTLSPRVLERAYQLQFAVGLIRDGTPKREASGRVRRKFSISFSTAWRLVDMAVDLAAVAAAPAPVAAK